MKRFAITHISPKTELRTLTFANQGRNFYVHREGAEEAIGFFREGLRRVLGTAADTLEVREVDCYANGDAKSIYFDDEVQS
jgi:hypothetical protein